MSATDFAPDTKKEFANLQEIEFNVLHRENAVVIQGVRNIDCLALQCILDTLKNPDL